MSILFAFRPTKVARAAEEAASTLAASIHPEQCIKVLCPIVQTADYPVNLAAIKMQTRAIERITKEPLHQLLPDIIPGLLQVRKESWPAFVVKLKTRFDSIQKNLNSCCVVVGLRQH